MILYTCLLKCDANRLMKTLEKFKRISQEENRQVSSNIWQIKDMKLHSFKYEPSAANLIHKALHLSAGAGRRIGFDEWAVKTFCHLSKNMFNFLPKFQGHTLCDSYN